MLESDSLRKVLYTKAIRATTALSLPCKIGEEAFSPPTDGTIFGEFWFRTAVGKQIELGGRGSFECTVGLLQFTLYAPEKSGDGPILKIGDQLKAMVNRQMWRVPPDGWVQIEPAGCQLIPGVPGGNRVVVVDAAFDYYHRDPNPSSYLDD